MGALSHVRVLDLSRVLAGPWASQILADLGADVIKVESPGNGDDTRGWGPPYLKDQRGEETSESAYYLCTNRGKRSICLDLKNPADQATARCLAADSDIVLENFKVGGAARFGLDYPTLSADNAGLIYCSITGFGQNGPWKDRPGYDFLIQALGGLMSVTGQPDSEPGGGPVKVGVALSDIMTGLYATIGILAALAERDQSGRGQHVDVALLDVTAATLANQASNYLVGGIEPGRLGNAHPNVVPYQSFLANDGYFIIAVGNDGQFSKLCEVLGCPGLAAEPLYATNRSRVENRDRLIPALQKPLLEQSRSHWLEALEQSGVPAGPINAVSDVFQNEQVLARDMVVNVPHPENPDLKLVGSPIKLSRTPVTYSRPPPSLGQHTEEILNSSAD